MSFDPISAALDLGGKLINRLIPDPAQKQAAALALLQLQQSGELAQLTADTDLAQGQLGVNQVEAGNANLFVSGWRPAVGWVCVLGLACSFVIRPIAGALVMKYPGASLEAGMLAWAACGRSEKSTVWHPKPGGPDEQRPCSTECG